MSSRLRVWVNGEERDESPVAGVRQTAALLADRELDLLIQGESGILSLGAARDEAEYLSRHIELMRIRSCVDPSLFRPASRPGFLGRLGRQVRRLLWRVLRHQHDWFVFQDNAIHYQLASELDCLHSEVRRRLDGIDRRLAEIESGAGRCDREGTAP